MIVNEELAKRARPMDSDVGDTISVSWDSLKVWDGLGIKYERVSVRV